MTEYLQYAYVFVWAALAVLSFIIGFKQGKYGFILSAFFVFMTVWYALNSFGGLEMFEGTLGIVFKCIAVACLAGAVALLFFERKKRNQQAEEATENQKDDN